MSECKTFGELREKYEELGEINDANSIVTVDDMIAAIQESGNQDHVYAFNDDHLGIRDGLARSLLDTDIDDLTDEQHEQLEYALEQGSLVLGYATRQITDEIQEDINEDRMMRGIDDDD